jgi:hypothetical protein
MFELLCCSEREECVEVMSLSVSVLRTCTLHPTFRTRKEKNARGRKSTHHLKLTIVRQSSGPLSVTLIGRSLNYASCASDNRCTSVRVRVGGKCGYPHGLCFRGGVSILRHCAAHEFADKVPSTLILVFFGSAMGSRDPARNPGDVSVHFEAFLSS